MTAGYGIANTESSTVLKAAEVLTEAVAGTSGVVGIGRRIEIRGNFEEHSTDHSRLTISWLRVFFI